MSEQKFPHESVEEFYEAVKEDIPSLIGILREEDKVKRTIVVPKIFDTFINRKLRADLLRFYGEELDYSDLLVGFALIGLATWMSENLVQKIAGDLDILDAFDEARKRKEK